MKISKAVGIKKSDATPNIYKKKLKNIRTKETENAETSIRRISESMTSSSKL
jgi:hypothetical protein